MNYEIYKITNIINKKSYIGQTQRDVSARFSQHKSDSKTRSHLPLHNAIRKYGKENFIIKVIEENLSKKEAGEKEKFYINKFKSLSKQKGYNVSLGGECGAVGVKRWCTGLTKENNPILARISEMQKGNNNSFFGKTHSDKNKEKWSKTRRGKNHGMFGVKQPKLSLKNSQKIWTKQEKDKISLANSKSILCIENKIIYSSIKKAAKDLKIGCTKSITKVLRGKTKKTKGYSFVYVDRKK